MVRLLVICAFLGSLALFVDGRQNGDQEVKEFEESSFEYDYLDGNIITDSRAKVSRTSKSSEHQPLPKYLPKDIYGLCVTSNGDFHPYFSPPKEIKDVPGWGDNGTLYYAWNTDTRLAIGVYNSEFREMTLEYDRDLKEFKHLTFFALHKIGLQKIGIFAFKGMKRLERLSLDSNSLVKITNETFEGLNNLRNLSLTDNRISSIETGAFMTMMKLERLDLCFNKLTTLHLDTFAFIPKLKTLELNNNKISKLVVFKEETKGLISVDDQHLTDEDAPRALNELSMLDLEGNQLSEIGEAFLSRTPRLRKIILAKNRITSISRKAFSSLTELRLLNLSNNQLSSIHAEWFITVTTAAEKEEEVNVDLTKNPWECDCTMLDFVKYVDELRLKADDIEGLSLYVESLQFICTSPESLKGKHLDNGTAMAIEDEFQCSKENKAPVPETSPITKKHRTQAGDGNMYFEYRSDGNWTEVKFTAPSYVLTVSLSLLGLICLAKILLKRARRVVPEPSNHELVNRRNVEVRDRNKFRLVGLNRELNELGIGEPLENVGGAANGRQQNENPENAGDAIRRRQRVVD